MDKTDVEFNDASYRQLIGLKMTTTYKYLTLSPRGSGLSGDSQKFKIEEIEEL